MYSKATQSAIAAVSRLAEVYDGGQTRLSAADIADYRGLQKPFVSKLLSTLANAGLVTGARGPGGGFTLARHPRRIKLLDVFVLFEREDEDLACPFGGGTCGRGEPCPLHDKLAGVQASMDELLRGTNFDVFRVAAEEKASQPTRGGASKRKRKTYRANR
ncbi:MAG: RrF2 family transcriptional regulator [Planctomycetota bacterium]|jgi:Rrf2 family iron-sulfur cluster assembly transcriptional regulator